VVNKYGRFAEIQLFGPHEEDIEMKACTKFRKYYGKDYLKICQ